MPKDPFVDDPLFTALRNFAAQAPIEQYMPPTLQEEFRKSFALRKRKRYVWRSSLSAILVFASVPAFAATNVLPAPIQKVVEKVNSTVSTSVQNLITRDQRPASDNPSGVKTNNDNSNPPKIKEQKIKEPKIKAVIVKPAKEKPVKNKPEKVKAEKGMKIKEKKQNDKKVKEKVTKK